MKRSAIYLMFFVILFACRQKQEPQMAASDNDTPNTAPQKENRFVIDATFEAEYIVDTYASGLYAIRAAEIVQEKARNRNIKTFASNIVSTHRQIVDNIDELAATKKISLPSDLNFAQRNELEKLMKSDPATLERIFIKQMENEHREDIQLLEKISKESEDNQITTVAIVCLSTLKTQYEEIMSVKEQLEI